MTSTPTCPDCGAAMTYDDGLDDNGRQWHPEWSCATCDTEAGQVTP